MSIRFVLPQVVFFLFLFISFISAQTVFAQGAGIGLSPAVVEDSMNPGSTKTFSIEISNLSSSRQTYYLFTRDIVSVDAGGAPIFADEDIEKTGYELSEWLSLSTAEVTLEPGQKTPVEVTVAAPDDATPGSHFGGMFVSMEPPRMRSTGAAVGYEVANIFSIRIAGDAVENAQIRAFATDNFIYGKPKVTFHARIENKGTVLVRPVGPLEIHNMFGKRVAMLTFNESKAGVFPLLTRDFSITWTDENPGFGRYQAVLSLVYGEQGRLSTISSTASFWILPMNIIAPALGVLAFILLTVFIVMRLYIKRTLRLASAGSRRIVRRRRNGGLSALLLITIVMLAVTALFLIILLVLFA